MAADRYGQLASLKPHITAKHKTKWSDPMKNVIFALVVSSMITACGDSGPAEQTPTSIDSATPNSGNSDNSDIRMVLDRKNVELSEDSETSINVTFENARGNVTLSHQGELPEGLSLEFTATTIEIKASDINKELAAKVDVIASDSHSSARASLQIYVINESVKAIFDTLKPLQEAIPTFLEQNEEITLLHRVSQLIEITGTYEESIKAKAFLESLREVPDASSAEALKSQLNLAIEEEYLAGEKTEEDVKTLLALITINLEIFMELAIEPVNSSLKLIPTNILELEVSEAAFSPDLNVLSRFVGNTKLGRVEDGQWVFKDEYLFLQHIIDPSTFICNAQ